jgi:hypothetical protein
MRTITEQELRAEIKELEKTIGYRSSEFTGEVGDFQWFLKQGIAKELHSMTTSEHQGIKPTLREMEDIMFNITNLNDIFDLLSKREYLESELSKTMHTLG